MHNPVFEPNAGDNAGKACLRPEEIERASVHGGMSQVPSASILGSERPGVRALTVELSYRWRKRALQQVRRVHKFQASILIGQRLAAAPWLGGYGGCRTDAE